MKDFKFFNDNKYNIEDDPLYHLNAYENMALGLISWCQRMSIFPIGYQHQFDESTLTNGPGFITRHLVIDNIIRHDYFECRYVKIIYEIYDTTGTSVYSFNLREQHFESIMRRYENI